MASMFNLERTKELDFFHKTKLSLFMHISSCFYSFYSLALILAIEPGAES